MVVVTQMHIGHYMLDQSNPDVSATACSYSPIFMCVQFAFFHIDICFLFYLFDPILYVTEGSSLPGKCCIGAPTLSSGSFKSKSDIR